jgi:hypothetical protein
MKNLTPAELLEVQKMTDEHAATLNTRKPSAATATDSDFGQPERMEAAFNDIKRLTVRHSVADSIKIFVLKRNMEAQKKKEKAKQTNNTSMPFWY